MDARIPKGLSATRQKILEVALAEWDAKIVEKPLGSNKGPVEKYQPTWAVKAGKKGAAWCAFFAGWCVHQVTKKWLPGGRLGKCMLLADAAKKAGVWVDAKSGELPTPGDVGIMDTDGDQGTNGHAFLFLRVAADGSEVNTVEGNCNNRVQLGLRSMDDPKIMGWIRVEDADKDFEKGVISAKAVGVAATR